MMLLTLILCALLSLSLAAPPNKLIATQSRHNHFPHETLPNLNDLLAVAKSPFEPVTMALGVPGARNDGLTTVDEQPQTGSRQTTRSVSASELDQSESTPTTTVSSLQDTTEAVTESKLESLDTAIIENNATMVPSDAAITPDVTEKPKDEPEVTTTTTQSPSSEATTTEASTTTETSTTSTGAPSIDAFKEPVENLSKDLNENKATEAPATTEEPVTTMTTKAEKSTEVITTTELPSSTTTTTEAPATTVAEVNTSPSTLAPEVADVVTSTTIQPAQPPKALDEPAPPVDKAQEEIATGSVSKPESSETPVTTEAPKQEQTTTAAPPTTTIAPTTTVAAASNQQASNAAEGPSKDAPGQNCNHLPTYETDELQKVFREETTFKNGTIKGKFTYINFDQRYRLVHYTRLPYGPVKIDLVEELGKPERGGGSGSSVPSSSSTVADDNAVLQLRNILPNSLFGFPFLGSSSFNIQSPKPPTASSADPKEKASDKYFYSTDSISTPNLLTPSVPVSLLPGQSRVSQPMSGPAEDTLSQSYFDNLQVGAQKPSSVGTKVTENARVDVPAPNQFQYDLAAPAAGEVKQQPGFVYTYFPPPPAQQPSQYQYSPVPLYSFNQPNYFQTPTTSARQALGAPQITSHKIKIDHKVSEPAVGEFRASTTQHQPHSHEHYVAAFMFATPPSTSSGPTEQINESSRLKLRIKTAKSLNQEVYGKSAPLKASSSSESYYAPAHSIRTPPRQRVGKQQNEFKQTVNSNPIVYHVLRSPVGRIYTLPQYNQAHSLAYGSDT